jgi:hypothetical protein
MIFRDYRTYDRSRRFAALFPAGSRGRVCPPLHRQAAVRCRRRDARARCDAKGARCASPSIPKGQLGSPLGARLSNSERAARSVFSFLGHAPSRMLSSQSRRTALKTARRTQADSVVSLHISPTWHPPCTRCTAGTPSHRALGVPTARPVPPWAEPVASPASRRHRTFT